MSQSRNPQFKTFVEFIREGNIEGVKMMLLENGNRSNSWLNNKFGHFKETALHLAVKYGHEEIVKLLLENGADIHATDIHSCTALHTAADRSEGINIITVILKCDGVNINAREGYGNTPVKLAAEKENSEAVRLLIQKEADVTIADTGDNTSLHVAAKKGHISVLELLLKKVGGTGIIGKQNKDKNTPLHLAVESRSPHCVAMLLNSGATSTMDVKNEQGQTALEVAKDIGNKKIIDFLEDPHKAKEMFQEKPKPAKTTPAQFERGCSVEADSGTSANNPLYQMTLSSGPQELLQQLLPNGAVQFNAKQVIIKQQFHASISGGNVALGHGSQVISSQGAAADAPPQPVLFGESHYNANITGGNASVGDFCVTNVGTGTPRTPSTAGSSDVPFFPEPQGNGDASSGFPTENSSSFGATEAFSHPVPEESPRHISNAPLTHPVQEDNPTDKINESLRRPVQEENPADKSNAPLAHPVQEDNPTDKINESLRRPVQEEDPADKTNAPLAHPVQEDNPTDKINESLRRPVQEEDPANKSNAPLAHPVQEDNPGDKINESLHRPVQEENPADKSNASLSSPVQEESPTGKENVSLTHPVQEESPRAKSNTSLLCPVQEESPTGKENVSLSGPVQEECPAAKANTSLPYSVPDEKPAQKPVLPVTSSCPVEPSMSIQTNTEGDSTPAGDHRITGEAGLSRSSIGGRASESIRLGGGENKAARTVRSVRHDNAEEAIAPSDTVGTTGDSRTVTNPGPLDDTGAFRSTLSDNTSLKPGAELGQTWQGTVGRGNERRASRLSRSAPKEVQSRLLKQFDNSPSHEMLGLDELLPESQKWSGEVESQSKKGQWAGVVTKGKNADRSGVAFHRAPLAKSSGPSLLLRIPDQPKSDVEPNTSVSVSQNTASSNVGACSDFSSAGTSCGLNSSSTSARSSSSKESPHRKARHSREDVTPDGTLPAGTVADVNESMRTAPNGDALSPAYHAGDEHSPDSSNNLSSEVQSSADGDSASSQVVDTNPEDDHEGQKRCAPEIECRLM